MIDNFSEGYSSAYFRSFLVSLERFSYDLGMKTREQNWNNKRPEIERFEWLIEPKARVAFQWLVWWANALVKRFHARELSRNQSILCVDVILQHDWPIEQCLLHISFFFGGKTKSPCVDPYIHWLIKQITNTYRNHFPRFNQAFNLNATQVHLVRVFGWRCITSQLSAAATV